MRTLLMLAIALLPSSSGIAQRPRVSPHEQHAFTVDGCTLTFDYGRPSTRGREIWGALVPWRRWWMPGADEATILTTDRAVTFAGTLEMPAGQHTLYMLPDPDEPKFIVSKQVGQFHTQYNPRQDLGRADYSLKKITDPVEQLTYTAEARPEGGGVLKLTWSDREYSVPFEVLKK
jgi:hypothetical protein